MDQAQLIRFHQELSIGIWISAKFILILTHQNISRTWQKSIPLNYKNLNKLIFVVDKLSTK
jgi:hypothetical protein